jgi:hypothetical protein
MKSRIPIAIAAIVLFLIPAMVFGQQKPAAYAEIAYMDSANGTIAVTDDKGNDVTPAEGVQLLKNWRIDTLSGDYVEIQVMPSKSIIKISQMTTFTITNLPATATDKSIFSVAIGKVRMVAGKSTGQYEMRGPSTICGVRGTDFGMDIQAGTAEKAFVLDGVIDFTNKAGETIQVAKGMMADAFAATFAAIQIPADYLKSLQTEMNFQKLNPQEVPGQEAAAAPATTTAVAPPPPAAPAEPATPAAPAAPQPPNFMDDLMAKLREILGMEIGSITINGITWSKVVISPQFAAGPLKVGLYLPIIYQGDMFNPADYYTPAGNDEWNFGGLLRGSLISSDYLVVAQDVLTDLLLKIKYFEFGNQRDPFFFKLGNLQDITIGHGLIMRNFANDEDFPAIRRVGLNFGLDGGWIGIEAMNNDASLWPPQIVGGRFYLRPFNPGFKLAFGVSLVADLSPASGFSYQGFGEADTGSPMIFNPGIDLDLPIIDFPGFFSIVAFADAAALVPYFQSTPSAALMSTLVPGTKSTDPTATANYINPNAFAMNAIFNPDPNAVLPFKNYGAAAGLLGNILILNYRFEYRYFTGTFKPTFYDTLYERSRAQNLLQVLTYMGDTSAKQYDSPRMGVYGDAGFSLPKIMDLTAGYFWPWTMDASGNLVPDPEDHLVVKATLQKGVIPVVNIWGTVSYERTYFLSTIPWFSSMFQNSGNVLPGLPDFTKLSLFDANTVVSAQITYPVAPTLDVIFLYTTTAARNPDGSIVPDPNSPHGLLPKLDTTISIETNIHF